jgi:hypothetical protein
MRWDGCLFPNVVNRFLDELFDVWELDGRVGAVSVDAALLADSVINRNGQHF